MMLSEALCHYLDHKIKRVLVFRRVIDNRLRKIPTSAAENQIPVIAELSAAIRRFVILLDLITVEF